MFRSTQWSRTWLILLLIALPVAVSGCFGWGNATPPTPPSKVSGQVLAPDGTPTQGSGVGSQSLVSGQAVAGATVTAYDFATGKQVGTSAVTDSNGKYTLSIPKGLTVIIEVTKDLGTNGSLRLSALIPDVGEQSTITGDVDAATTVAAESWAPKMGHDTTVTPQDFGSSLAAAVQVVKKILATSGTLDLRVGKGIIEDKLGQGLNSTSSVGKQIADIVKETIPDHPNAAVAPAKQLMQNVRNAGMLVRNTGYSLLLGEAVTLGAHAGPFVNNVGSRLKLINATVHAINDVQAGATYNYCDGTLQVPAGSPSTASTIDFSITPCSADKLAGTYNVEWTKATATTPDSLTFTTSDKSATFTATHTSSSTTSMHVTLADPVFASNVTFDGSYQYDADNGTATGTFASNVINASGSLSYGKTGTSGAYTTYTGSFNGQLTVTIDPATVTLNGTLSVDGLGDSLGTSTGGFAGLKSLTFSGAYDYSDHTKQPYSDVKLDLTSLTLYIANADQFNLDNRTAIDPQLALSVDGSVTLPGAQPVTLSATFDATHATDVITNFTVAQAGIDKVTGRLDVTTNGSVFQHGTLKQATLSASNSAGVGVSFTYTPTSASGTITGTGDKKLADLSLVGNIPWIAYIDGTGESLF